MPEVEQTFMPIPNRLLLSASPAPKSVCHQYSKQLVLGNYWISGSGPPQLIKTVPEFFLLDHQPKRFKPASRMGDYDLAH